MSISKIADRLQKIADDVGVHYYSKCDHVLRYSSEKGEEPKVLNEVFIRLEAKWMYRGQDWETTASVVMRADSNGGQATVTKGAIRKEPLPGNWGFDTDPEELLDTALEVYPDLFPESILRSLRRDMNRKPVLVFGDRPTEPEETPPLSSKEKQENLERALSTYADVWDSEGDWDEDEDPYESAARQAIDLLYEDPVAFAGVSTEDELPDDLGAGVAKWWKKEFKEEF